MSKKPNGFISNYCISKFFIIIISVMFIITVFLSFKLLLKSEQCSCPPQSTKQMELVQQSSKHKLAVLVPFRDRFEELLEFVPYLNEYLNRQNIIHDIFILNQVDTLRFNRASLINVGYLYVKNHYDYIVMHDVDLLPLNENLSYDYPEEPMHLAAPTLHPRYHYDKFIGGILLINRQHFALVNGLSNKYWGWGLEDDEFYVRLKDANLNINRPKNIKTGTNDTFKHIHGKHRKRDTIKCFNQREVTRKRDRYTGLHDVNYQIKDIKHITINKSPCTILNVELYCDFTLTPWCDCNKDQMKNKKN